MWLTFGLFFQSCIDQTSGWWDYPIFLLKRQRWIYRCTMKKLHLLSDLIAVELKWAIPTHWEFSTNKPVTEIVVGVEFCNTEMVCWSQLWDFSLTSLLHLFWLQEDCYHWAAICWDNIVRINQGVDEWIEGFVVLPELFPRCFGTRERLSKFRNFVNLTWFII